MCRDRPGSRGPACRRPRPLPLHTGSDMTRLWGRSIALPHPVARRAAALRSPLSASWGRSPRSALMDMTQTALSVATSDLVGSTMTNTVGRRPLVADALGACSPPLSRVTMTAAVRPSVRSSSARQSGGCSSGTAACRDGRRVGRSGARSGPAQAATTAGAATAATWRNASQTSRSSRPTRHSEAPVAAPAATASRCLQRAAARSRRCGERFGVRCKA